ncbi:MAG TPA: hypothetical protein VFQ61_22730 [Polyangiaceae bacterium]|nr:hypothetical protein [Polyangiaceae bacterium]
MPQTAGQGTVPMATGGSQGLAGRAGGGESSTAGGTAGGSVVATGGSTGGAPAFPPATFTQVYNQVFLANCLSSACHDNSRRQPYFGTKQDTYEFFVQPNVIFPGEDPAWSGIYQIMAWEIMPPDPRPNVPPEQLDLVAGWIMAGALND